MNHWNHPVRMSVRRRLRIMWWAEADIVEAAETLSVRRWRFEQLVEAGYTVQDASEIASNTAVDLEGARRLVQCLGCPPELAVRILS
jgi:hypothetical protein